MMTAARDPKPGLLPRSWDLDLSAQVATPQLESHRPQLPGSALPGWLLVEFLLLCPFHSPGRLQPWQLGVGGRGAQVTEPRTRPALTGTCAPHAWPCLQPPIAPSPESPIPAQAFLSSASIKDRRRPRGSGAPAPRL